MSECVNDVALFTMDGLVETDEHDRVICDGEECGNRRRSATPDLIFVSSEGKILLK